MRPAKYPSAAYLLKTLETVANMKISHASNLGRFGAQKCQVRAQLRLAKDLTTGNVVEALKQ